MNTAPIKIVVIEDELPAREKLTGLLSEVLPGSLIVANLDSVKDAAAWFGTNPAPNLVMLDVQLADGTAFDLLERINIDCPLIFTTAYSKYALDAFKTNSIEYLLKPIKKKDLEQAVQKLANLRALLSPGDLDLVQAAQRAEYKKRFVIRLGERLKTLAIEEVAYFSSEHKNTYAHSADGLKHPMDHNLDALEQMLDPQLFFRINRQYLLCLKGIAEMKVYTKGRVIIKLNPEVKEHPVVSSDRAADFKLWLAGDLK